MKKTMLSTHHRDSNQMADDDTTTSKTSTTATTEPPPPPPPSMVGPLVAGVAGGAVSTAVLYPLDLIKVRLQVMERPRGQEATIWWGWRRIVASPTGWRGLYQGLNPALVVSAISWGGYFGVYESVAKPSLLALRQEAPLGAVDHFVAATGSGMLLVAITNPLWLIKTRMQLQQQLVWKLQQEARHTMSPAPPRPYAHMMDAARTIVREEGWASFYRGVIPALLLTSHGGIQFVAYEFLKQHVWKVPPQRAQRRWANGRRSVGQRFIDSTGYLTMGAISKIIASTATYPLQVMKSRLQQRAAQTTEDMTLHHRYRNILDTLLQMAREEGMGGFWRGCMANALRVAPSSAITFVVYESVMDMWG